MRRLLSLLLVLIASSLVMTATVHARENLITATIECSGAVHTDGDADQSQGDDDTAVPHHHGTCHGSVLGMPVGNELASTLRRGDPGLWAALDAALASGKVAPGLRPPTA